MGLGLRELKEWLVESGLAQSHVFLLEQLVLVLERQNNHIIELTKHSSSHQETTIVRDQILMINAAIEKYQQQLRLKSAQRPTLVFDERL